MIPALGPPVHMSFPRPIDALRARDLMRQGFSQLPELTSRFPLVSGVLDGLQPLYIAADLIRYVLAMRDALPEDLTYEDLEVETWPLVLPLLVFQEPVAYCHEGVETLHALVPVMADRPQGLLLVSNPHWGGVGLVLPTEESLRHSIGKDPDPTMFLPWALIKVLDQRIVVESTAPWPTRQYRRQAERRNLPPVRVLDLRSPQRATVANPSGGVEWSHRWVVRGHWRRQWYPSVQRHRLIWVDPYVKGPEDAPLDVRPTVWTADL